MAAERGPAGTRFFCTAGRGLEPFLLREVRARLGAAQVEYVSGKVFFTATSDLDTLKRLKSAERLFLLVTRRHPLPARPGCRGRTFRELQNLVSEAPDSWLDAIGTWERLLSSEQKEGALSPSAADLHGQEAGDDGGPVAKKPRTGQSPEQPRHRCQPDGNAEETAVSGQRELGPPRPLPGVHGQVAAAAGTADRGRVTFRVSCRCSGAIAKTFTPQELGRHVGVALMKQFGWSVDLRQPRLEVFLHLSDVYAVVGIPLLRVPLASRPYIRTAGLRSTVAWAMASLADIQAGALVLDPMCGLGTVLLEAAREWPDARYVGADLSEAQLLGAGDNLKAAGLGDRVELLKASVTELPFQSEDVDVIVCDVPFGKKFKSGEDIQSILGEMERVLRAGGTLVLLLSEAHCQRLAGKQGLHGPPRDRSLQEETTAPAWGSLVPVEAHRVSLGSTEAFLCKYSKRPSSGGLLAAGRGVEGPPSPLGRGCTESPSDPRPG